MKNNLAKIYGVILIIMCLFHSAFASTMRMKDADGTNCNLKMMERKEETSEIDTLKFGDSLRLELDANPTTGKYWKFKLPRDLVLVANDVVLKSSCKNDMMQCAGKQIIVIKARKPERVDISFSYINNFQHCTIRKHIVHIIK